MKYIAKPVVVDAFEITGVTRTNGNTWVTIGGRDVLVTHEQLARIEPVAGDFLVIQEDRYVYLNPRSVFLRKYSPVPEPQSLTPEPNQPTCLPTL